MKIIAKTRIGSEYLYSASSARKVSARSAETILKVVNEMRWRLKDGETWHIYDVDEYSAAYDYAQYQAFTIRNGIVTARCY